MTKLKQKNSIVRKTIYGIVLILGLFIIAVMFILLAPNTPFNNGDTYLYISDQDKYDDLLKQMKDNSVLSSAFTFNIVAKQVKYDSKVRPGRYKIAPGMSNLTLIRKLKGGNQDPLKLTINNIRTKEKLAGKLSNLIMADSLSILNSLNDAAFLNQYNMNIYNVVALFIPNTYEVFWDMDTKELFDRMKREYDTFWNDERKAKAAAIPMTQTEVMTLASIIEEETNKKNEYPIIAGLYINRLKKNMPLQACPTIRFALNDYTINRVLIKHLQVISPYNTYKNQGLPPGPIRLPSTICIDAVLNYKKHNFLFMTAKESLNGEHNFASTYAEHSKNARRYQRELNKIGIK